MFHLQKFIENFHFNNFLRLPELKILELFMKIVFFILKRSRICTYLYDLSGNLNVLLTYVSHLGKYKPEGPQNMFINN